MIAGGRSNLTYSVTDAEGTRWALRRPPLGKRLGSAHDMGREARVVGALADTPVPVPGVAGFCEDESVNEAPFYVMDFLPGPILRTVADADPYDDAQRRRIGENVVDTLVAIHDVDPDAVGLGELGKKADYVARTLHRWIGQWEKSKTRELPLVTEVHDRLAARIPEQGPATIVHGDYRLDNMILSEDATAVAGVVDWELCTLGDPLADVGLLLVYWAEEGDQMIPLMEPATMTSGFPTASRSRPATRSALVATSRRSTSTWRWATGSSRSSWRASSPATWPAATARPGPRTRARRCSRAPSCSSSRRPTRPSGGFPEVASAQLGPKPFTVRGQRRVDLTRELRGAAGPDAGPAEDLGRGRAHRVRRPERRVGVGHVRGRAVAELAERVVVAPALRIRGRRVVEVEGARLRIERVTERRAHAVGGRTGFPARLTRAPRWPASS